MNNAKGSPRVAHCTEWVLALPAFATVDFILIESSSFLPLWIGNQNKESTKLSKFCQENIWLIRYIQQKYILYSIEWAYYSPQKLKSLSSYLTLSSLLQEVLNTLFHETSLNTWVAGKLGTNTEKSQECSGIQNWPLPSQFHQFSNPVHSKYNFFPLISTV